MTALSWQPPPVTKCGECPHFDEDEYFNDGCLYDNFRGMKIYLQNKNGITQTCPMWQEQNKDEKCTAQT